jgi:trehalose 2-sulfotransferase
MDVLSVPRTSTYVVCATPRSGSTLLCQGLAATGVAGIPIEYFNPRWRAALSRDWGCDSELESYAAALRTRRTSDDGVFGVKLQWHQLETLGKEAGAAHHSRLLEELLGARPSYVHLRRDDLERQAVSLWTAEHTGQWTRTDRAAAGVRVPYSFAGIERCRFRIALDELQWLRFFRANGVTPIEVSYEELCRSYEATLMGVIAELIPGAESAAAAPAPRLSRMADARSQELLERFQRDLRRRGSRSLYRPLRWRVRGRLARVVGSRNAA